MQAKRTLFSLLLLFILFYGCTPKDKTNTSIEGIWESIGYGKILKIDSTTYKYFDITSISCLPSKIWRKSGAWFLTAIWYANSFCVFRFEPPLLGSRSSRLHFPWSGNGNWQKEIYQSRSLRHAVGVPCLLLFLIGIQDAFSKKAKRKYRDRL